MNDLENSLDFTLNVGVKVFNLAYAFVTKKERKFKISAIYLKLFFNETINVS